MSRPQVVLGLMLCATAGIVTFTHYAQVRDKKFMHRGVVRDREQDAQLLLASSMAAGVSPDGRCIPCELKQNRVLSEEEAAARARQEP